MSRVDNSMAQEQIDSFYFSQRKQHNLAPAKPVSYSRRVVGRDKKSSKYELRLEDERLLVQHVAFITGDEGLHGVTAVMIEHERGQPLRVRLAAGLDRRERVLIHVNTLFGILSRFAKEKAERDGDVAADPYREELFDQIVRFNTGRILKRIGLKASTRRRIPFNMSRLLSADLAKMGGYSRSRFKTSVRAVASAIAHAERGNMQDNLKKAVQCAHRLCYPDGRLEMLQRQLYYEEQHAALKGKPIFKQGDSKMALMEVAKLAQYYEACRDLLRLAQLCPHLFSTFQVDLCPRTGARVHAEMDLISYYEWNLIRCPPRALGCSKSACFLCHAFIRTQGKYLISRAHNRVYRWEIPTRKEYTGDKTVTRLKRSLSVEKMLPVIAEKRLKATHYPLPLESVPNSQAWAMDEA